MKCYCISNILKRMYFKLIEKLLLLLIWRFLMLKKNLYSQKYWDTTGLEVGQK